MVLTTTERVTLMTHDICGEDKEKGGELIRVRAKGRHAKARQTAQHEKAFAQSARARVRGLCKVSPPAVLVRRQAFIIPVGQGG